MRLLVSVRDPSEVGPALAGGADIIDAKEPSRGALGPVSPSCLRAIDRVVPDDVPLSAAMGDFDSPTTVATAIAALPLRPRQGGLYLKLSWARRQSDFRAVLAAAVGAAARHEARPAIIAVEYADHEARAPHVTGLADTASAVGAAGILVDTRTKNGRPLLDWWTEKRLADWIRCARAAGLSAAVAGSLGSAELARIAPLRPDVIGVRGSACANGRSGTIQSARVRQLRIALEGALAVSAAIGQRLRPVPAADFHS